MESTISKIARNAELRDQELLRKKIEEKDRRDEAWNEYNEDLGRDQFFEPSCVNNNCVEAK